MKLIVLAFTSKTYNSEPAYTGCEKVSSDRADLTRKLPCMDTWVSRLKSIGHEVIFFDGDNEVEEYDEKNQILHLTSTDTYDYFYLHQNNQTSNMLVKLQDAVRWVLKNREFDYILRVDDGTYVNAFVIDEFLANINGADLKWSGQGGGGGMFFSKKGCEKLISINNPISHLEDVSIFDAFHEDKTLVKHGDYSMSSFYALGENLVTIHYATGKRMYYCDFIISNYHLNLNTSRKMILGYRLDGCSPLNTNRVSGDLNNTGIWYGLDRDQYGWEYYDKYCRSTFRITYIAKYLGKNCIESCYIFNYDDTFNLDVIKAIDDLKNALKSDGVLRFVYTSDKEKDSELKLLRILKASNSKFEFKSDIKITDLITTEYVDVNLNVNVITFRK